MAWPGNPLASRVYPEAGILQMRIPDFQKADCEIVTSVWCCD